jgi:hypothetical protein
MKSIPITLHLKCVPAVLASGPFGVLSVLCHCVVYVSFCLYHHARVQHFETPYVVRLHNFFEMAPPQECFKFEHPLPSVQEKTRNTRTSCFLRVFRLICARKSVSTSYV